MFILVFVYGRIAWVLSKKVSNDIFSDKTNKRGISEDTTENSAKDIRKKNYETAKRNTIKTLVLVAVCFVICWTSNQVWFLLFSLGYEVKFDSEAYQFTVLLVCVNCIINPFIYLIQYKEYQKALHALLCGKRNRKSFDEIQSTSTSTSVVDNVT